MVLSQEGSRSQLPAMKRAAPNVVFIDLQRVRPGAQKNLACQNDDLDLAGRVILWRSTVLFTKTC
jgi:hypothetical protein